MIFYFVFFSFFSIYASDTDKCKPYIQKIEKEKKIFKDGALAILHHGKVIYQKTFSSSKKKQVTEKTLFSIASVSKAITSLLVASMVDRKQITFYEGFQIGKLKLTLNHILSHSTGYFFTGDQQIEKNISSDALLAVLEKKQRSSRQTYFYSNAVFNLIERIFEIKHTSLDKELESFKAKNHIKDLYLALSCPLYKVSSPKDEEGDDLPFPSPYQKIVPCSAGIITSLQGMIEIFKTAFGYNQFLSRDVLKKLHTPFVNTDAYLKRWPLKWPTQPFHTYYGLGWRIFKGPTTFIFHGGYLRGVSALIGYVPDRDLGIIFLSNQSGLAMKQALDFWKSTF